MKINAEDFFKVDIRKGKVVETHLFKEALKHVNINVKIQQHIKKSCTNEQKKNDEILK